MRIFFLIIIVLLYSFESIACGALNGKGYQCILFKKENDQKKYYTIGDKIFFIFNKKEIHEPFLNKDTSPMKISTHNHGFYNLNVENIEWNKGKYILNKKSSTLLINNSGKFYFNCKFLGKPMDKILKFFKTESTYYE